MPSSTAYRTALLGALFCGPVFAQQNPDGRLPITTAAEPYVFLIRDPVVLAELGLTAKQRHSIQSLNDELDPALWSMQNQGAAVMADETHRLAVTARERAASILGRQQQHRLEQIELWALGARAFLGDDLPARLGLSLEQSQAIRERVGKTQEAIQELSRQVQSGKEEAGPAEKKAATLQSDLQRELLARLSDRQKQAWIDLLGPRIDLETLGRVTFAAPTLTEEPDWINSPPLSSEQLRGKVVALHFYAFGCINCKRNFPWYKDWHASLRDRGLVVLGIQTPETDSERDVEKVRAAAAENGLEYPIVVDLEKRNWNAWGNSMWPATYLIDKRGRVRYWWYGELDWQGAGGQNLLRARIEQLLAEPTDG
ncbi:MAG: redoxin domain-containing protein [Thermoguttaceae bacterium]